MGFGEVGFGKAIHHLLSIEWWPSIHLSREAWMPWMNPGNLGDPGKTFSRIA